MRLLILFTFLSSFTANSQNGIVKYTSYYSSEFKKSYEVNVAPADDDSIEFYIEVASLDALDCDAIVQLTGNDILAFKDYLNSLKKTFKNWKDTAIKNKVTTLTKEIDYDLPCLLSIFRCGKNFGSNRTTCLRSDFKISKGKYQIRMYAYDLADDSGVNQTSKGITLRFNSETDFESLIQKIDIEKGKKFLKENEAKKDLFKQ